MVREVRGRVADGRSIAPEYVRHGIETEIFFHDVDENVDGIRGGELQVLRKAQLAGLVGMEARRFLDCPPGEAVHRRTGSRDEQDALGP